MPRSKYEDTKELLEIGLGSLITGLILTTIPGAAITAPVLFIGGIGFAGAAAARLTPDQAKLVKNSYEITRQNGTAHQLVQALHNKDDFLIAFYCKGEHIKCAVLGKGSNVRQIESVMQAVRKKATDSKLWFCGMTDR